MTHPTPSRSVATALLLLAAVTLTGCSASLSEAPGPSVPPAPAVVVPIPPASATDESEPASSSLAPTNVDLIQARSAPLEVTMPLGTTVNLIGSAADPAEAWEAELSPAVPQILFFLSGEALQADPQLQAVLTGTVTVRLTNTQTGATATLTVTVVENPTIGQGPIIEDSPAPVDMSFTENPEGDALAKSVIGKTEQNALTTIAQKGYLARVVSRDGQGFPVTMDYSVGRINLVIVNSKVADAYKG
jgi:hypothetical protein